MWKKLVAILISIVVITIPVFAEEVPEYVWINECVETTAKADKIEVSSNCAVVYDRASRSIIWGKNENKKVPMASTTKIMTAIILLENVDDLNNEIVVAKEAAMVGGSSLKLKTGDKLSYEALLYGLLLRSGNDAATQIAISIAGSRQNFANLMNEKADEMLLENTHFVTPHGLDSKGHYTTAYELAKIADYALNIPKFAEIVSTKRHTIKINGYPRELINTHELLGNLKGVNGVKTGFTNGAGRCLVTSVKRGNFEIITVVLGANTKKIRTKDSINMIEYVYKHYELVNVKDLIKEEFNTWKRINEKRIEVIKGIKGNVEVRLEDLPYEKCPIRKEEADKIKCVANADIQPLEAPVLKGTVLGNMEVSILDKPILEIEILTKEEIRKKTVWDYILEGLSIVSKAS